MSGRHPVHEWGEWVPPVNTSVLPTDTLVEIVDAYHRHADALIEIACGAHQDGPDCGYCLVTPDRPCWDGCPGLLARRALGVA